MLQYFLKHLNTTSRHSGFTYFPLMKTLKQLFPVVLLVVILAACGSDPKKQPAAVPETVPVEKTEQPQQPSTGIKPSTPTKPKEKVSHNAKPNPAVENKLLDRILALPEIQKIDKSIRKKSKNARGLNAFISGRPSDDKEYYTVSVAEDNGGAMVSLYTFNVFPDNTITYYSIAKDIEMSLEDWKKTL